MSAERSNALRGKAMRTTVTGGFLFLVYLFKVVKYCPVCCFEVVVKLDKCVECEYEFEREEEVEEESNNEDYEFDYTEHPHEKRLR